METRKEKFKRLAILRVNNTAKQINLIGNLSNKSTYEYSDEDVRKIFNELEKCLRESRSRFSLNKNRSGGFQL